MGVHEIFFSTYDENTTITLNTGLQLCEFFSKEKASFNFVAIDWA